MGPEEQTEDTEPRIEKKASGKNPESEWTADPVSDLKVVFRKTPAACQPATQPPGSN